MATATTVTVSSEKKDKEETVEMVLGPQYGSDPVKIARGEYDPQRLSNITDVEAFCIPYLNNLPKHRGGNMAKKLVGQFLNLKMSVGGWKANQGIRVVAASKGAASWEKARDPGIIGRNITNRRWKEKAEAEGKEIE